MAISSRNSKRNPVSSTRPIAPVCEETKNRVSQLILAILANSTILLVRAVGLVDPVIEENSTREGSRSPQNRNNDITDGEIRQAQGWVRLGDGTVVLTSYPVIPTPYGPLLQHPGCSTVSN